MRLLMIANLWEGSTTCERARLIENLGVKVLRFDMTPFHAELSRLEQAIESRLNFGRGIRQLNRDLVAFAQSRDFDAVWITKGNWIYPRTVQILRERALHRYAIHHTNDAIVYNGLGSRYFIGSIPLYDLFVTTKPWEVDLYYASGAKEVLVTLHAHGSQFSPDHCIDLETRCKLSSDICFIGHCEPHYARHIRIVADSVRDLGAIVKVWGPRWTRYARFNAWARSIVQGDGLWGNDYPHALRCSKIALGLLNRRMPETSTSRTFEIPATGTFMLAERTEELQELFDEGREVEFFSTPEELCSKARYYLLNNEPRMRIAAAGHERCVSSGYSAEEQMRRIFAYLESKLSRPAR